MKTPFPALAIAVFFIAALRAAEVAVPSAPPPAFADTESVTNAPIGAALATARFLRVELSHDATPSNNVE